ncbi:hypothetical protein QE152_g28360 [Popillia japonica]|uniref:Secreted protein n=1 Tax=Popillia japonica TaxID=7064 RepID=A0AAW1JKH5_POPJA
MFVSRACQSNIVCVVRSSIQESKMKFLWLIFFLHTAWASLITMVRSSIQESKMKFLWLIFFLHTAWASLITMGTCRRNHVCIRNRCRPIKGLQSVPYFPTPAMRCQPLFY